MDASASQQHLPPDFYEDQRPQLRGVLVFFLVLATTPVLVRVACQLKLHRRLYWDDVWIVIAVALMDALIGVNLFGLSKGLGLHASRVGMSDPAPPGAFITLWKVGFANSILTQLSLFAVKVSLLLLYKRVFWVARWFRAAWWPNLAYAVAWVLAAVFTAVFQCWPVSFAWNRMYLWMRIPPPFPVEGRCISQYFVTVIACLGIASDLGIWALPMAAVLKLQMTARRKAGLAALLSLGLIAVACSIGKAANSYTALSSTDVSWASAPLTVWAEAEQATAVLCACIPVIVGAVRALSARLRAAQMPSPAYHVADSDKAHGGRWPDGSRASEKTGFLARVSRSHLSSDSALEGLPAAAARGKGYSVDEDTRVESVEMHTPRRHGDWV